MAALRLRKKGLMPSGEKEKIEEEFYNRYHIVLDNPLFPCDPFTNRIWRDSDVGKCRSSLRAK